MAQNCKVITASFKFMSETFDFTIELNEPTEVIYFGFPNYNKLIVTANEFDHSTLVPGIELNVTLATGTTLKTEIRPTEKALTALALTKRMNLMETITMSVTHQIMHFKSVLNYDKRIFEIIEMSTGMRFKTQEEDRKFQSSTLTPIEETIIKQSDAHARISITVHQLDEVFRTQILVFHGKDYKAKENPLNWEP